MNMLEYGIWPIKSLPSFYPYTTEQCKKKKFSKENAFKWIIWGRICIWLSSCNHRLYNSSHVCLLLSIVLRDVTVSRRCPFQMLESGTPSNVTRAGDIFAKRIKVFFREQSFVHKKIPSKSHTSRNVNACQGIYCFSYNISCHALFALLA